MVEHISTFQRVEYERALEEGRRLGLLESIEMDLRLKFATAGVKLLKKAQAIHDYTQLRRLAMFINKASNVREVRKYLG